MIAPRNAGKKAMQQAVKRIVWKVWAFSMDFILGFFSMRMNVKAEGIRVNPPSPYSQIKPVSLPIGVDSPLSYGRLNQAAPAPRAAILKKIRAYVPNWTQPSTESFFRSLSNLLPQIPRFSNLGTGLRLFTRGAISENVDGVARANEAVLFGNLICPGFHLLGFNFHGFAAGSANQMVVMVHSTGSV